MPARAITKNMPVVPDRPNFSSTTAETITVSRVIPEAGLFAVAAMALAATVVKKNAEEQRQRQAHRQHGPADMQLSKEDSYGDRSHHHAEEYGHDRNIAVGPLRVRRFAVAEGVQRDAERSRHHAQRFKDADQTGGSDGAHADEAHIVAVDFSRRHVRDRNRGRIDRNVAHVAADEPDHRAPARS